MSESSIRSSLDVGLGLDILSSATSNSADNASEASALDSIEWMSETYRSPSSTLGVDNVDGSNCFEL